MPGSAACSPSAPRPRSRPPWSSYAPSVGHAARRLGEAVDQVHPAHRPLADPARGHDARRPSTPRSSPPRPTPATGPSSPAAARSPSRSSTRRIAELTQLLEPGRAVQFNSLFLDPYLWKLQVGGKRLVQKARQSGAPIDGVVISAGIPELEEAVDADRGAQRRSASPTWCSSRAPSSRSSPSSRSPPRCRTGTSSCTSRAAAPVVTTRGRTSTTCWSPRTATCASCSNITLCVGGGIGTPERAAEYLSGTWSQRYGFPIMPVDGILVGTAAMATLEATTSPAVKQLLVETTGTDHVGRRRKGAGRHGIRAQPARCRHPRDRQRRVALRPPARRRRR